MDKTLIQDYGWILGGSQRTKIVRILDKPKTPRMISHETGIKFSNVSDCLRSLKERKLVVCLNETEHLGRVYDLTEKGKKLLKELI